MFCYCLGKTRDVRTRFEADFLEDRKNTYPIYIYIERERERERQTQRERKREREGERERER